MDENDTLKEIRDFWNRTSDSDWYNSLRMEEIISDIIEHPRHAFHPAVIDMLGRFMPVIENKRILLPSSGDNHAAIAFAAMGGKVTSADISERQLDNAKIISDRFGLGIEVVRDDTMKLLHIDDEAYDLVYTSNGTLSWIYDLDGMYMNIMRVLKPGGFSVTYDIHPFGRPFSGEAWKEPRIVKSYHDVMPHLHWRVQDIINAQAKASFVIREMAELPAVNASFWYAFDELKGKTPAEYEGINDWHRNPMAALPAWLALVSEKPMRMA